MAIARAVRRLLQILTVEEEQAQAALEASLADLRQLQHQLQSAVQRERSGRRLVSASAHSGQVTDRLAGLEETSAGQRASAWLRLRLAPAQERAAQRRAEFLSKRVERKQAEALIRNAEKREALEAARRAQQSMDDSYLARRHQMGRSDEPQQDSQWEERGAAVKLE